jgi:hypothetical protein
MRTPHEHTLPPPSKQASKQGSPVFQTFTITTKLSLRKHHTPSKHPSFSLSTLDIQNLCFSSQTPNSCKTPICLSQHLTSKNYSSLIEHPTPPAKHPPSFTTFDIQELFFSN